MGSRHHQPLSSHNARQGGLRSSTKTGGGGGSRALPAIQEESSFHSTPPADKRPPSAAEAEDEESPLSKFKDWQAVAALAGGSAAPALPPHLPVHPASQANHVPGRRASNVAADVALLVHTILDQATAAVATAPQPTAAADGGTGRAGVDSLAACFRMLADPAVLSLASDRVLAELLHGLQPLLRYSPTTRQWALPGLGPVMAPLQHTCQDRLSRTTLPCDATLAIAAAVFFSRVTREAGSGLLENGLLAAVASYTHSHCRTLSGEALASLLALLVAARFQPPTRIAFGNCCVERLLRLHRTKAELQLRHFADVVEALAQLHCIDGLSAPPVINLAVATAQALEDGQQLDVPQLTQLARVMNSVAVVAANTAVESRTLLAATAVWHLLMVRAESLALRTGGLGAALAHMWSTSRILMAVAKASAGPCSFQLPDRLGLVSHAAWLDQEQRVASGLTSAQRRVLAALGSLRVSPSKVAVNSDFLDIIQISIAVRMCIKRSNEAVRVAILIREQSQLLRDTRQAGASQALGAEAAQEHILTAAGFRVVCLEAQTCLQLPSHVLSEELGALLMGEQGSLRFVA